MGGPLIHEWKYALLAPPPPLVSVNDSITTTVQHSCVLECSTNNKASVAYNHETWAYLMTTVLATVAFLLPLYTN